MCSCHLRLTAPSYFAQVKTGWPDKSVLVACATFVPDQTLLGGPIQHGTQTTIGTLHWSSNLYLTGDAAMDFALHPKQWLAEESFFLLQDRQRSITHARHSMLRPSQTDALLLHE